MNGWIFALVYGTGYVVMARKTAVAFRNDPMDDANDWFERALSRAAALLVALLWPIILFGAVLTGKLPKSDREVRAELADREMRLVERERRIAYLEPELDIWQ